MTDKHAGPGGFTFVEVLATLVFVGLVMPVVLRGITLATGVTSTTRHRNEAAMLAQNVMAELVLENSWDVSAVQGDFAPDYPGFEWQAQVEDWQPESSETALYQVTVTVTWRERGAERSVAFTTLARPPGN